MKGATCTGTLVGPRVIATAAHCVATGDVARFTLDGVAYTAAMTRFPKFPEPAIDLALGLVNVEIRDIDYDVLPAKTGLVKAGMEVMLLGYGCTQPVGGTVDGILRYGTSEVTRVSAIDATVTKEKGAAICWGDSGGPARIDFTEEGLTTQVTVGLHSRGDLKAVSIIARWDEPEAQAFARSWAAANNVEICGIHRACPQR